MNKTWLLLPLCACLQAAAQTNATSAAGQWLVMPKLELRALTANPEETPLHFEHKPVKAPEQPAALKPGKSATEPSQTPSILARETSLSAGDFEADLYRRLERNGYMSSPEPKSSNPFVRSMDAVFRPEVVQAGKKSVSCSIITAIKRKNPFCLLNPVPIYISW